MSAFFNVSELKNIELSTSSKNKLKKVMVLFTVLILLLTVALLYYYLVINVIPKKVAKEYIDCLKKKDYSKAIQYYDDIPYSPNLTNDEITAALKNKYENISDISLADERRTGSSNIQNIKLRISDKSSFHEENISIITEKKSMILHKEDVKVVFPFKMQDIIINGTNECEVYIDGKYAGEIENSSLNIKGILCGNHQFESRIEGICSSGKVDYNIDDQNYSIDLPSILKEDFKESISKVILEFCDGWASYCINQKPEFIKPYLMDKLYNEYIQDNNRFNGSKYTNAEHSVNFLQFKMLDHKNILVSVNENWFLKEVITTPKMRFKDNNKDVLEQRQYITWNYNLTKDEDKWKIQLAEQTEFKKEIINSR